MDFRMTLRVLSLSLVLLSWSSGIHRRAAGEEPQRVGEFGSPHRLVVAGAAAYDNGKIAEALLSDFDVILASHPAASYQDYRKMLQQRCLEAFRHQGFAQARVNCYFDERTTNTTLTVSEGPRLRAGELQIAGARHIDTAKLKEILQRKGSILRDPFQANQPEDENASELKIEGPLWATGKPASFSAAGENKRRLIIQSALAEMGFHYGRFECELLPDNRSQRVALRIKLIEEGVPAFVDEVELEGLHKNTSAAVLRHIGWRKGDLMTASKLVAIDRRLQASGRFITHHVELLPPDANRRAFRLAIKVLEFPHVTPLDERLTEVEQVLLKFHRWATELDESGLDIVMQTQSDKGRMEVVFSREHGALATLQRASAEAPEHAAVFVPGEIGYNLDGLDQFLAIKNERMQVKLSIGLHLSDDEDRAERPSRFLFGFGVKSLQEGDSPVALDLDFAPVFFLSLAHSNNAACRIDDGVLIIQSDAGHYELDTATGRPLKIALLEPDQPDFAQITFQRGALKGRLNRLRARTEKQKNAFNPKRPVSSAAQFLLHEELLHEYALLSEHALEEDEQVLAPDVRNVLTKLLTLRALQPLDDLAAGFQEKKDDPNDDEDDFTLTHDVSRFVGKHTGTQQVYARFLAPVSDLLFPRQSWPWTLWRESCFVAAGEAKHTEHELTRLINSPDSGPVCLLVTSELLGILSPVARREVAAIGLKRLTLGDFRNEYDVLLNREFLVGQCVHRLAEIVQSLNEREAATLGHLLFDDDGAALAGSTRILRETRDHPVGDVVPLVLDEMWVELLETRVRAALESRAQ